MGVVLTGYIAQSVYYKMVIKVIKKNIKINYEYETRN